jgi:hypothetical protein
LQALQTLQALQALESGDFRRYLAQIMAQPDGTFLVSVGATVMSVMGSDEALGLRLRLDGIGTIMLPTVYDPSELRSEFNGKARRMVGTVDIRAMLCV